MRYSFLSYLSECLPILYLPEITADKAAVAWAASVTAMILPVSLFVMGQGALEQGIAASGIKE